MSEDLERKLKQAQEDHKRMQSNFEIVKKKNEKMQIDIDQLKHKRKELELAIEEQKKKLSEYENIHSDVDKVVKANQQQQNKAVLAESAANSEIQNYLQNLLSGEDNEPTWEGPSSSSASTLEQNEEYEQLTQAIQQNTAILTDLLKRVETIQKRSKENN